MQYIDDVIFLIITYAAAYGLGTLVSKLWWWLRIVVLLVLFKGYLGSFDFSQINYKVFVVLIIPAFICIYPSVKKTLSLNFSLPNPFRWIYDKMRERQYLKHRDREAKADEEALERLKRLMGLQEKAEEMKRQAAARAKAEEEAKEKAEQEAKKKAEEEARKKAGQEEQPTPPPNADTKRSVYEVLGVKENDSLERIEKAYKELSKQYHPNMVNHLGKEFQEMAHEKFIEIKWAWDEVKKRRKG